jgi:hypothetical protein
MARLAQISAQIGLPPTRTVFFTPPPTKPPLKVRRSALRHMLPQPVISPAVLDSLADLSIVWDFGAGGCTGWAIEAVNFVVPLHAHLPQLSIVTGRNTFCPGLNHRALQSLEHLITSGEALARAVNRKSAMKRGKVLTVCAFVRVCRLCTDVD